MLNQSVPVEHEIITDEEVLFDVIKQQFLDVQELEGREDFRVPPDKYIHQITHYFIGRTIYFIEQQFSQAIATCKVGIDLNKLLTFSN